MDFPHMLFSAPRSDSLLGLSEPLSPSGESTSHSRRTTAMSTRSPKSMSPRRHALTDLNATPMFGTQRSKSEANISTLSSLHKLHSSSSDLLVRPLSRETRSSGASVYQEERSERPASSFFTKSSMLLSKRKKSKLDLMSARTEEWLEDTDDVTNTRDVQELSKRRKSKHSRTESAAYEHMLKKSISDPYNFQHLTHTAAAQARALQCANHYDMVTEFSAIRASQAPRTELKGIKAESLHKMTRSIGTEASPAVSPSMASVSPTRSRDNWSETSHPMHEPYSKTTDSFTRISSKSFSSPTPPRSPPAYRSSRMTITMPPGQVLPGEESPIVPDFGPRINAQSTLYGTQPFSPQHSTIGTDDDDFEHDPSTIAQAVTTPDDSAYTLGVFPRPSPSFTLADVPEEDEAFPWTRHSIVKKRRATVLSTIRPSKSFPTTEVFKKHQPSSSSPIVLQSRSPLHEDWSAVSDPTLPFLEEHMADIPVRSRLSKRISTGVKGIEESWEADIDYCYEHAAEADSAFDWDQVSIRGEDSNQLGTDTTEDLTASASSLINVLDGSIVDLAVEEDTPQYIRSRPSSCYSAYLNASRLTSSTLGSTTDSATSSAVEVPGIVTPVEPINLIELINIERTSSGTAMLPLSPSILAAQEFTSRVTHEETFHQKLADSESSKQQYPPYAQVLDCGETRETLLDHPTHHIESPLSTRDSSIPSRAASISAHHGTARSVSSLPELVHSKVSHERVALAAESLVDHLASLKVAENSAQLSRMVEAAKQTFFTKTPDAESLAREDALPAILPLVYPLPRQRSFSDFPEQALASVAVKPEAAGAAMATRSARIAPSEITKVKLPRTSSYSLFPR